MTAAERALVLQIEAAWARWGSDTSDEAANEEFSELLSTLIFAAHDQEPQS